MGHSRLAHSPDKTLSQKVNGFRLKPYAGATRLELWEEAEKQQQWFEEHLTSNANLAKQGEQILKDQIAGMEERHMKEVQLWADMKLQYEARAQGQASKIKTLKLSLDEMRVKTDMGIEKQLTEALEKGWAGWTQQAAELHTFSTDQEN